VTARSGAYEASATVKVSLKGTQDLKMGSLGGTSTHRSPQEQNRRRILSSVTPAPRHSQLEFRHQEA
jgi:hypothetical protein